MGRLKIKSCDPFYKGPRKRIARKGDLSPANDDDQDAPKSLIRLFTRNEQLNRHKKQRKPPRNEAIPPKNTPSVKKNPSKEITELVTESQERPSLEGRSAMFVRKPGETTRSYLERIDIESKIRIVDCLKKEKKKSDKRKKYLEERKNKLKLRKKAKNHKDYADFADLKDEVKFGDIVKAPPQLSAKPRGGIDRKCSKRNVPTKDADLNPVPIQLGLKRKEDLKVERTRAIAEYRMAKKIKQNRVKLSS